MWEKTKRFIGGTVVLFVIGIAAHAAITQKSLHPIVKLISIKALATQEARGDELYLTTTSFYSNNKTMHERRPEDPLNWPSRYLNKVKNFSVWDHTLEDGEAVTVIFNLIEQDVPPWDTDDLMGVIRLHLKNQSGKLVFDWAGLNNPIVGHPTQRMFILNGEEGGRYEMVLELAS